MEINGIIRKMRTVNNSPVDYFLPIGENEIHVNEYIGKKIELKFLDEIHCLSCGKITYKSFFQGYCYPCFSTLPQADECILHPEKCQAHLGISRDMEWSEKHCLQDHYVYIAVSSGVKVGVTRSTQIPTRWIDQGAWKAVILAKTPNRYLAGKIEVELKKNFADKTNWQRMLKNQIPEGIDILAEKEKAASLLPDDLKEYVLENPEIQEIKYPVEIYPQKVKSVNFDKVESIKGTLTGIKGQYLIFDYQNVINIRKHGGYLISLKV